MKKLSSLLALMTAFPLGMLLTVPTTAKAQVTGQKPLTLKPSVKNGLRHQRAITRADENYGVSATLRYEQLPDMQIARMGHQVFPTEGGLTVVGGHTTGGTLTVTAEQYKDGSWTEVGVYSAHDGAFAVELTGNRFLVGGGFSQDNSVGQSADCDIYNPQSPSRLLRSYRLSVPRAKSKAIFVDGKIYVSGNWQADDNVFDCKDTGADNEFWPVGSTSGRSNPYLFADSNGRVMSVSVVDNWGNDFGFYTTDDGSQLLVGDLYTPSTGNTTLMGMPFSPASVPMALSEDVKSSDYHFILNGSNLYFMLAKEGAGYMLYAFDFDGLQMYNFSYMTIPTADKAGQTITWRGGVIVNAEREEVYLIGVSGPSSNQTLHIISMNIFSQEWTIASASGFRQNMLTASWTLLSDGRLACTGGGININSDAQRAAYIFNVPVAGQSDVEPGDDDAIDCIVIETASGKKVKYLLTDNPQFRHKGQTVTLTTSKVTIDYQADDIARVYMVNSNTTGIEANKLPGRGNGKLSMAAGQIQITGLEPGEAVNVYRLTGALAATMKADQNGDIVISIDDMPGQMSIVKTKHQSFKIIRK